jgi:cellulose synthase/poly-beta-1,6-N-acetylglucosamine synthase-like glycosyltransferase
MTSIRTSVIVPGYNVAGYIHECLDALLYQDLPSERYEIIYVDDASTDDSAEVVRRYQRVRVLALAENRGQATARNLGIDHAAGEIILFTDADCVPAPDWIGSMLEAFEDPQVSGTKGVYRTRQRNLIAQFAQVEYESRYDRIRSEERIDFVDTYSAGYRVDVLRAHGGFDPSFRIDEDQELSFRISEAGRKLVFSPKAAVYHRHPDTIRRYWKRKFDAGHWKAFVLRIHPEKALRDSHTPQRLKLQLGLAAAFLAGLAAMAISPGLWPLSALAFAALTLAATPLVLGAYRRAWQLGLLAHFMILVRALALGVGLGTGMLRVALGRSPVRARDV